MVQVDKTAEIVVRAIVRLLATHGEDKSYLYNLVLAITSQLVTQHEMDIDEFIADLRVETDNEMPTV